MDAVYIAITSALWLGILTSISPCPLAANIVAVSYLGKDVKRPLNVLIHGLLYTLGRTISYVSIAFIAVKGVEFIPQISFFLQSRMNQILGPVLIIAGFIIIEIIPLPVLSGGGVSGRLKGIANKLPVLGPIILGLFFALTFCPVSAALFFGTLIPLAIKYESSLLIPLLYGMGTALPVVIFSAVIAFSTNKVAKIFNTLKTVEPWMRKITGAVFTLAGLYYVLIYIFNVEI
ncbi:MAG: sulfite exporter TauE/SafE family protein [Deltaproteobacteria bacterium]|nr:sulfite exporter TauE/SafE family protein [Deltaproteobacteria bacterium]